MPISLQLTIYYDVKVGGHNLLDINFPFLIVGTIIIFAICVCLSWHASIITEQFRKVHHGSFTPQISHASPYSCSDGTLYSLHTITQLHMQFLHMRWMLLQLLGYGRMESWIEIQFRYLK